ncbi:MAG TPA: zinc ribbon domain-containing protein [Gemmatimonadaceae bacterium]|nr:zinc ribbon domain-containing protein [Gemmatimonadaceae bacterium]
MPTYEFRCPDGHDFEKFYRSISAAPRELSCPVCGKMAERQLSAGAGLVFKGSGFYITDYGKDGKKPQTPAAGGEGNKPPGEDTTKKADAAAPAKGSDAKPGSSPKPDVAKPGKTSKPKE